MTIAIPCRPIRVVACLFAALFTLGSCGQKSASLPRLGAQAVVLAFGLGDNRLKADHVHPNSQGYAKLAGAIAKLLKERGAI